MSRPRRVASSSLACVWLALAAAPAAAVPGDPFDMRSACRIAVGEESDADADRDPAPAPPGPGQRTRPPSP